VLPFSPILSNPFYGCDCDFIIPGVEFVFHFFWDVVLLPDLSPGFDLYIFNNPILSIVFTGFFTVADQLCMQLFKIIVLLL